MARPVDVIVRRDEDMWAAWSPQCRGLTIVQPTPAHMRKALPAALREFFGSAQTVDIRIHVEDEVRGAVVRVAQDDHLWERQHTAARIAAALGDPDQRAQILAETQNSLGEVVFVCALPGDTGEWLMRQLDEDGDFVHAVISVADNLIWGSGFGSAATGEQSDEMPSGFQNLDKDVTFGEIMRADSSPHHMKV